MSIRGILKSLQFLSFDLKKISTSFKVAGTVNTTVVQLLTLMIEENVKFQLEASENKAVFFPMQIY